MQGDAKHFECPFSSYRGHRWAIFFHFDQKQLHLQCFALFSEARNCNGRMDVTLICQHLYGQARGFSSAAGFTKPTICWKYTVDIFSIWPHSEDNCIIILREIHSFPPTIRFTASDQNCQ